MSLRHLFAASAAASLLVLTACSGGTDTKTEAPKKEAVKAPVTMADVLAHPRRADNAPRDQFRNPKETLEFFEVGPGKKVGEIWPGWYTPVIAPYLAENDGTYVAILRQGDSERVLQRNAAFTDKYVGAEGFGAIEIGKFGTEDMPILETGDLDILLTFLRRPKAWRYFRRCSAPPSRICYPRPQWRNRLCAGKLYERYGQTRRL